MTGKPTEQAKALFSFQALNCYSSTGATGMDVTSSPTMWVEYIFSLNHQRSSVKLYLLFKPGLCFLSMWFLSIYSFPHSLLPESHGITAFNEDSVKSKVQCLSSIFCARKLPVCPSLGLIHLTK